MFDSVKARLLAVVLEERGLIIHLEVIDVQEEMMLINEHGFAPLNYIKIK